MNVYLAFSDSVVGIRAYKKLGMHQVSEEGSDARWPKGNTNVHCRSIKYVFHNIMGSAQ